ncbi:hypothetical protein JRQ81_002160 [Phrynocephalus forsythii]|uniref:Large ribosomal subunit protein mL62 n=1 Tax=Phrynocephalus forsythii TaxID=171643 RepID=A0A9Q0XJL2_9SAUR|nr:hypothetical protein JRQ81_002160 [Phrynocephalus forsythii]
MAASALWSLSRRPVYRLVSSQSLRSFPRRTSAFSPPGCEFRSAYSLDKLYPSQEKEADKSKDQAKQTVHDIPVDRLSISYSRSSGPGGQNVNKVNSKAEVRFHLTSADWIAEDTRQNMAVMHRNKINREGELIVMSQVSRYQMRNLADCLQKIRDLIAEATEKPHVVLPEDAQRVRERADEDKFTASPFVNISSNGSIVAFQAHRLTSSCNLDVHAFPFDKQACNLTIMSSAYSDEDILMKSIKTSKMANQDSHKNYLTNGEWKFEQLRIVEHVMSYDTFSTSTVIYEITMTRRSILQVLVLILPTFSLFLLDMAISYAFASPGEKIVFKVTLILEVSFLSMILNDKLPTTSDNPPVIAKFFTGLFMFMVLGILENAFILYLREAKPTFQCFRGKKFLNKFKRTKERKSEDPTTCFGSEMRREDTPLPENEHSDSLVFLKHLNAELKQIKKHLALEEVQNDAPKYSSQDKSFLQVEKTLYFARLILSLVFLTYIVIIWRH